MKPIITKLAGVTFGGAQENIKTFGNKDIGSYALVRQPDNPHDPNAIRVALFGKIFMGFVPNEIAKELAPLMDEGRQFMAFFVNRNVHPLYKTVGLTVEIREMGGNQDTKQKRTQCYDLEDLIS
jgi:hypothetical protein